MNEKKNEQGGRRERKKRKRKINRENRTDKYLSYFSGWSRSLVLGKMSADGDEYCRIFNRVQRAKILTN